MKKLLSLVVCAVMIASLVFTSSAISNIPVKSIKLNSNSITLKAGEKYNLKVEFTPQNTSQKFLSYSTSNKNVASVDDKGNIIAVGSGKAVITASVSSNSSVVATCNVTVSSAQSIKFDKPVEFTMLYNDMSVYPYSADWLLWSKIKELTNVTLKLTVVPSSDYVQKRAILISSGDAPQIMPKTYAGQEVQFIPSGTILPVSDYISQLPNYSKTIKDWNLSADVNTLKQKDGKYYILPGLHQQFNQDWALIYRVDLFEKYNIKTPTTYDELYTALKKLKEIFPKNYPLSERENMNILLSTGAQSFGATWGWNTGNGMMFNQSKDAFVFSPVTDDYKTMLTYFNKLSKEGLLDPESLTQSAEIAYQKFVNGKSFVMGGNSQDLVTLKKSMNTTLGVNNFKIARMPQPAGPKGALLVGSRLENGVMLSAKSKQDPNFDKMLKFVDWLWFSDQGKTFTKWGVEGTTYRMVDGKYRLMPNITFQTLNPAGTKDLRKQFGFSGGVFSYGGRKELVQSMMSADDLSFLAGTFRQTKQLPPDPPVLFSDDEREQATLISKPLSDYATQMSYKFILGIASIDKEWDKFVADCKTKGSDKLQDMENKIYNSTKTSVK